jgi:lipoyl synthase
MIDDLIRLPLEDLQSEAFQIRETHFGKKLTFSLPGIVSQSFSAQEKSFPGKSRFEAISVTGSHCSLQCGHCKGKLLESMIPAEDPESFLRIAEDMQASGGLGMLVSGGANRDGDVPLENFILPIKILKEKDPGFQIIVHTGLIKRETAEKLKEARIDQVLIDVIGDDETIREVYHLDKRVEDYEETLRMLKEMGHRLAPHIIIGHHYGEIKGEWRALEMVSRIGVETLVLVVIKSLSPFAENGFRIPLPEETSRISAIARILNPLIPIRMGCIRPAHPSKAAMEKGFILSGVNTIAYPLQATVDFAIEIGLQTKFVEKCCSLI